ncbi:MAG: hypothetical protein JWP25_8488 [Bradyrhizobium sp.]|nr:hypothetical protein [Bradyrhizobium sp.]
MAIFSTLWNNYPMEEPDDLFNDVLGGGWPALIGNPAYENTCTIRLSITLNRSGFKVPSSFGQKDGGLTDKNGDNIIIRVLTGEALVQSLFGDSYWGESRQPGTPIDMTDVPSETGILIYRVRAGDAAGHIDLWKNNDCRKDCHSRFAMSSYQIALWKLA